jgi:hypothetical protein
MGGVVRLGSIAVDEALPASGYKVSGSDPLARDRGSHLRPRREWLPATRLVRPDHRGWRIHAYGTIAHGDRGAVGQPNCRRSSNGRSPSRRAWPLRPGPRRWRAGRKRWLALRVAGPRPVTLPAGLAVPSGRCKDHGVHWVVTVSWDHERTWNPHHALVHRTPVKQRTECDGVGT